MAVQHPAVITAWFGLNVVEDGILILDDPTLGLLDTGGVLVGDVGSEIQDSVYDIHITRGRSRELDTNQAGMCTLRMRNQGRLFDPLNADYITDEDGVILTDEDGNKLIADGTVYADLMVPGKRLTVEVYGQTIYDGSTEDWKVRYEPKRRTDASVAAVDALGTLARRELNAFTATGGQTAGERITDVLNRPEIAFGYVRDIGTGVSTLQADDVTWRTNALTYLNKVVKSDLGNLFADRNNVLTFRDRHSVINGTSVASFATDGTGIPIHGIELAVGGEFLFNAVRIDREGGTLQTAEDTTSQGAYGIRPLPLSGLLMDSDSEALSMAEFLLALYHEPDQRISSIRVNVSVLDDADKGLVSSLDLGSIIDVSARPLDVGATISQASVIEGIEHTLGQGQPHIVTLRLSTVSQWGSVLILDDATYGLLDSDVGLLAF